MQFTFQTYHVVDAMAKYIEEYKDTIDVVGLADFMHIHNNYETLVRSVVKPSTVLLDESEFASLGDFL